MSYTIKKLIESWSNESGNVNSTTELFDWINELNKTTYVNINECSINDSTFWFYDDYNGEILNRKRSFFSIKGMRRFDIGPELSYAGQNRAGKC